ncbi:MAG TPA: DegQ family serine endoprotease [Steroidobacteraceae bacterium]|nr:DegQ family serine endoprotease [Steroidobacteraceae bacterium]
MTSLKLTSLKLSWLAGCLFLLTGLILTGMAQAQSLPDFRELVRANQVSVVNISTTRGVAQSNRGAAPGPWEDLPEGSPFREFFKRYGQGGPQPDREARSLGSGFIISSDGKILTNAHVVDGADEIKVKLSDRTEKVAKLLGIDKDTDVALLKIDAKNLQAVKFGDSDKLVVGEWVLAIGSPFSLEYTATHGIVSATGRQLQSNYVPFIQTDVPVNPGNSGGPLFNMRGEVIGINSQIFSRTGGFMGLSFAIPSNIARNVEGQLASTGRVTRGWLGVQVQSVNNDLAGSFGLDKPTGALIGDVNSDGPAAKAGAKSGDIILEYNNQPIHDSQDLPQLVAATQIGKTVPVKVLRDGKPMTLNISIAALPDDNAKIASKQSEPEAKQLLNVAIAPVPDEAREQLGIKTGGVLVAEVRPGPASRAGIESGDVILRLDGKEVTGPDQFVKLVKELPRGKPIAALVQKQEGGKGYYAMTLPIDKK